jgi:hypothetical protein
MQHVQEQQQVTHLAMIYPNLAIMLGMMQIQEEFMTEIVTELVRKNPIHGVCTICMAMSGKLCKMIGIMTTTALQLTEVHGVKGKHGGAFIGAVALSAALRAAGRRFAAATLATVVAALAFALSGICNYFTLYHITTSIAPQF